MRKTGRQQVFESLNIRESQILKDIQLPNFLLTKEEFDNIKIPQLKNFQLVTDQGETTMDPYLDEKDQIIAHSKMESKKRNIAITVILLILLAVVIFVVVYLAVAKWSWSADNNMN